MSRPVLEVADIFRQHGEPYRQSHQGHLSWEQLKVMSAIERCRTPVLGGHVLQCPSCEHVHIAYNSCRNRHCPKCQASAARRWFEARQADLLPVAYYHVVFTMPAELNALAYQNKAVVYDCLFKTVAKTLRVIAGDKKRLGAKVGATLVLHTWGSAMTHHPHIHGIIPGGGLSADGQRWIACRPGFFLPVRVLSRLFRRLFLDALVKAHQANQLQCYHALKPLEDPLAFAQWLQPLRRQEWVVYAKQPFAGPEAVLAYLSRYTHRVAIANSRLLSMDDHSVTFTWKDYRCKQGQQHKTMALPIAEFIRRFLLHVLPKRFHRIRHVGLFANACRKNAVRRIRHALAAQENIALPEDTDIQEKQACDDFFYRCPACGATLVIIDILAQGAKPRAPPGIRLASCA